MPQWTLSLPYTLEAERFMLESAGHSYDPARETEEQGKQRTARELAQAEKWAQDNGLTFLWEPDWAVGDHQREFPDCYAAGEPETCEGCSLRDSSGRVLASLWCIDDATDQYRRVIEAQLAQEALYQERANAAELANSPELRALVEYAAN